MEELRPRRTISILPVSKRSLRTIQPPATGTPPTDLPDLLDPSDRPAPGLDLQTELTDQRAHYVGSEPVTIYQLPRYLSTSIDRVRVQILAPVKPGISVTVTCCVSYGCRVLSSHPDVKGMVEIKSKFDAVQVEDTDDLDELAVWFGSFAVSVSDNSGGGTAPRMNILMPDGIRQGVGALSGELKISSSALMQLCLLVGLSGQPGVLDKHQSMIDHALRVFFSRVRLRKRMGEQLLKLLEGGYA